MKKEIIWIIQRNKLITAGRGWLMGSRPRRNRLAFWFSFSHACAKICSAAGEVKWGGIGLLAVIDEDEPDGDGRPASDAGRLLRRHDFK